MASRTHPKIHKPGERPVRYLIYGRNKIGKTTLAATAPGKTLILDPEAGAEFLDDSVDVWTTPSWLEFVEAYKFIAAGGHGYEWIVVDGLTKFSNMSLRYVMKQQEERNLDRVPGFVEQRDYGKSGELIKGMLYNFHALPYGVIYTAQDRMDSGAFDLDEDEDAVAPEVRFVPDLPKGVRSATNQIVDCIGRIYTVKVEGEKDGKLIKGRQRRLWIAPTDQYDTGYRLRKGAPKPPDFIKGPTIPKLMAALDPRRVQDNG